MHGVLDNVGVPVAYGEAGGVNNFDDVKGRVFDIEGVAYGVFKGVCDKVGKGDCEHETDLDAIGINSCDGVKTEEEVKTKDWVKYWEGVNIWDAENGFDWVKGNDSVNGADWLNDNDEENIIDWVKMGVGDWEGVGEKVLVDERWTL